jgi:HD-GYP domain-containing protein (c-di-GMP phosphodiesterase class II)
MTKRIHIEHLRPGMYVVDLDKSWWRTPFFSHKWLIQDGHEIQTLKEVGVREVFIDVERGCDVEDTASTHASEEKQEKTTPTGGENQIQRAATPPSTPQEVTVALQAAVAMRSHALAVMEGIFEGVKIGKPVDSPALQRVVHGLLDHVIHRSAATLLLMQIQRFEETLLTHALDVCVFALLLGVQQELSPPQLEILGAGALLHDIGKTRLPRNLLRKTSPLRAEEQKLVQEHPGLGFSVLSSQSGLNQDVLRIVLEHHERPDGSGFPHGLTAAILSPLSQMVSLVNAYDGLVSGQAGRVAYQPTQALRRLYQMGQDGAFVSEHVLPFIRALGVYPVGAAVELDTGAYGLVVATNPLEALRPTVLVITDNNQHLLAAPRLVNLADKTQDEPATAIMRPLEATAIPVRLVDYFRGLSSS